MSNTISPERCPFCGYKYRGKKYLAGECGKFECPSCGAEGPFPRKDETKSADYLAAEAWNRRVCG